MNDHPTTEKAVPKESIARLWKCLTPSREAIVALLLCAAVDLALTRGQTSFRFPDALEYAQIARSLASGNGYRVRTLWLSRLSVPGADPEEWAERGAPDVRRPPLHVLLTASAFRLFGASDRVAVVVSAFIGTLAAWFFFLFMRNSFGRGVAWMCLGILLFDPGRIFYNPSGLTEPLFTLLIILFGFLLMRASRARHFIGLGVLLGLLAWTRHNAFLLYPAALLAVGLIQRPVPWRRLGLMVLVLIPFSLLPALRNRILIGEWDPVGMPGWVAVNDTGVYPEHVAERSLDRPPSAVGLAVQHPGALLDKAKHNLKANVKAAATAPSPFLWILVFVGVIWGAQEKGFRLLLVFCILAEILFLAGFSIGEFEGPRFYVPLTPLWLAVAGCGIRQWIRLPKGRKGTSTFATGLPLAALCLFSLYPGVKLAWLRLITPHLAHHETLGRVLGQQEWAGRVFLSDVPWAIGWYGDHTAYWLPMSPDELPQVLTRTAVDGIFLSAAILHCSELSPDWMAIYQGRPLSGYRRDPAIAGFAGAVMLWKEDPKRQHQAVLDRQGS